MNFLWKTVNLLLIFVVISSLLCFRSRFCLAIQLWDIRFLFLSDFTADSGFCLSLMNFPLFYLFRRFLDPSLVGACPFGSFETVYCFLQFRLILCFFCRSFLSIFGFGLVFDAFSNFSLTALFLGLLSGFGLFLGRLQELTI